jgi:hypothetical protein
MPRGVAAVVASLVLLFGASGCFGYTKGAKAWSYVGNILLIGAGGTAIGVDHKSEQACEGMGCSKYTAPVSDGVAIGSVLIAAGIVGIVLNATRPLAKPASQGR